MLSSTPHGKFSVFVDKVEIKLILALIYIGALAIRLVQELLKGSPPPRILYTLGKTHVIAMLCVGVIYFWRELLMYFLSPINLMISPLQDWWMERYLKHFKQNQSAEVVVVLGHANWLKLEGWVKPIFCKGEIELLANYLTKRRQDFAFYPEASYEDVETIMRDTKIKEVYFWGHGNTHGFELITGEILYYCEFNDPKYSKAFAHQVHCGDPCGKSLLDYVVPAENRAKCFFFRKPIDSIFIRREFKRRIGEIGSVETAN